VVERGEIGPYYDSMIAKVIVHDTDRRGAIARAVRALQELELAGMPTTQALALDILRSPEFAAGDYSTGFLDEMIDVFPSLQPSQADPLPA
jgi:geranyl-CoA carboxylase alpha subunit